MAYQIIVSKSQLNSLLKYKFRMLTLLKNDTEDNKGTKKDFRQTKC